MGSCWLRVCGQGGQGLSNKFSAPRFQPLPDILRLVDGELVCVDGGDIREYLREYARYAEIGPDEPMTLMRRAGHQRDREDAMLARNWGA